MNYGTNDDTRFDLTTMSVLFDRFTIFYDMTGFTPVGRLPKKAAYVGFDKVIVIFPVAVLVIDSFALYYYESDRYSIT